MLIKKLSIAVLVLVVLAIGLLCLPAAQEALPEFTEAPVETTPPVTFPALEPQVRNAYQAALKTIHDELTWVGLEFDGTIALFEPGTIEEEHFSLCDVDGDGTPELLVTVANTYTAGMMEVIYGYDAKTDAVRVKGTSTLMPTHYVGMIKAPHSHNQGLAGDVLWPYVVMMYDAETDTFQIRYDVDAWCRELTPDSPDYPEDIDTENDGYVFLITQDEQQKTMNRREFENWENALFSRSEPLDIAWKNITSENIAGL